jgi:hypothetical protein
MTDTMAEERIEGPTPNGGAYALAYFSAGGVPVEDQAQADAAEVIEFTADSAEIMRTYADLPGTFTALIQSVSLPHPRGGADRRHR